MNRLFLITFTIFASVMLLSQVVSSAEGKYSEARQKAKEREASILSGEDANKKAKLEKQKKDLEPKTSTSSTTDTSGTKAAIDTQNASYLTALKDAKASLKQAKEDLNLANRALLRDSSNSAKQQAVEDAKIALEKAEIVLKIVLLNKP